MAVCVTKRRDILLNHNFDPYDALQQLANSDKTLDENIHKLIRAHNALAGTVQHHTEKIQQQGEVIDTLIAGLDAANKSNELMLTSLMTTITNITQGARNGETLNN
jgi:hypothetical protein